MDKVRNSESVSNEDTGKSMQSWDEAMSAVQQEGLRLVKQLKAEGQPVKWAILAPREVKGGDTIPLAGVALPLDWKIAKRLEMVEIARDLITNAYIIDSLDPGLLSVLRSIIEGKGLYEHSIGEFFQLYGQFEGKYGLTSEKQTRAKMESLLNGEQRYLKRCLSNKKWELQPLPFAVRHILAHLGRNPNTLDQNGDELRVSIELLRSWVRQTN